MDDPGIESNRSIRILPSVARRAVYTLYIIALMDFIAVSLFVPLLNREIKNMGGSAFTMGLVSSAYGAIQLFSGPIIGHGSDIYGRKQIFIAGIIVTSVSYVLLGFATTIAGLLVARIIAGVFKHTQTLSKTVLADLAPNEKSYVLGNFNAFGNMGFIVGPTIGGHLVQYENGFRNVCSISALLFFVNMVLFALYVPETSWRSLNSGHHHHREDVNQNNSKDKEPLITNSNSNSTSISSSTILSTTKVTILALLLIRFLFSLSTIVSRANLQLILEAKFNASVVSYGYLNSFQALISTITGFMVGPITALLYNEENKKMVIHFGLLQLISMACLYYAPSFQMAGLALLFMSAINPYLRVSITSLSLGSTKDPGALLGLGQTSTSLSRMLGPLLAGTSQELISDDGPALMATIASLFGCLAVVFFVSEPPAKNEYVKSKQN